jgi:hypothetical protein
MILMQSLDVIQELELAQQVFTIELRQGSRSRLNDCAFIRADGPAPSVNQGVNELAQ